MDNNNYNTLNKKNNRENTDPFQEQATVPDDSVLFKNFPETFLKKYRDKDKIAFADLGLISYGRALDIQLAVFEAVRQNNLAGIILLLEHEPVITIGNNKNIKNILADEKKLKKLGISLVQSDRGGDVTFHGPGQIICYPVFNLNKFSLDLTLFVYNLEQVIINTLKHFGVKGQRIDKLRGVFVEDKKIASIGIHVKKWISYHGFSLNADVNLDHFKHIVACGLKDHAQTSLQELLNRKIKNSELKEIILENFKQVFKIKIIELQ